MRLLNALTLQLELFPDPVPDKTPYAILSHTWAHDEVCFDDMKDVSSAQYKAGFAKIRAACAMTRHHGLGYIWVDTCCIDKSSSAELSEAINSMFRWYKKSTVCFAFLSDLPQNSHETDLSALRNCRWWTRGWTLQELIAPTNLIFFDECWNSIGRKLDLCGTIESITGISRWVLDGSSLTSSVPLVKRMSWAAARDTTRIEDKAYCLLGIFDVNITMMYGEGSRAFIRLQEEILGKTTDLSIFAWQASDHANKYWGILAESPAEFRNCSCIESSDDQFCFRDEISLTNRGVKIQTALQYVGDGTYMMDLHCYDETPHAPTSRRLGIYLQRALDAYYRFRPEQTAPSEVVSLKRVARPIFLVSTADDGAADFLETEKNSRKIFIEFPLSKPSYRLHDVRAVPETYWNAHEQYFSIGGLSSFTCFVRFSITSIVLPPYGATTEETTSFILVCDLTTGPDFRISLYAQTGLQSSGKPGEFIDPFADIDQYGPLGDAFSLSILRPGEREDRRVSMIHKDRRHNYTVLAGLCTNQTPSFFVTVGVEQRIRMRFLALPQPPGVRIFSVVIERISLLCKDYPD